MDKNEAIAFVKRQLNSETEATKKNGAVMHHYGRMEIAELLTKIFGEEIRATDLKG